MTKARNITNANLDKILYFTGIEAAGPEWVAFLLEQIMFINPRAVMVGKTCNHMPLMDRCQIVRML